MLDVLASRSNVGVVSGESFVDGCIKDISFQRKVGYIQQEDFHLATMTVREALQFSAIMRQSGKTTKKEKVAYVEEAPIVLKAIESVKLRTNEKTMKVKNAMVVLLKLAMKYRMALKRTLLQNLIGMLHTIEANASATG